MEEINDGTWINHLPEERRKAVFDDVAAMIKKLQDDKRFNSWTMEDLERAKHGARRRRAIDLIAARSVELGAPAPVVVESEGEGFMIAYSERANIEIAGDGRMMAAIHYSDRIDVWEVRTVDDIEDAIARIAEALA